MYRYDCQYGGGWTDLDGNTWGYAWILQVIDEDKSDKKGTIGCLNDQRGGADDSEGDGIWLAGVV